MAKKTNQDILKNNDPEFFNPNDNLDQTIVDPGNLNPSLSSELGMDAGIEVKQPNDASVFTQNQFPNPNVAPNQNIQEQALLNVDRSNSPSTIDDAINKSIFGNLPRRNNQGAPADPLIQQGGELFRGANENILKGNVSGSVIGNQPIFVGGGDTIAFDVLNNRQKAIQDAAIKKQQDAQAFLSKGPPIVKDQRFQRGFNSQFNTTKENYIKQAEEEFGADWATALQDQTNPLGRAFVQDMANYDFIAGQADQVTDFIAEIDKNLASGDNIYSDETLQLRDQYDQLQGAFLNGDIDGMVNLANEFDKFKGYANLDKIINDQGIDIKGTVTQYANILEGDDSYTTTTQKQTKYEDQIRIIAEGLAKSQMRDSVRKGIITEEEIFERLNARYGYENIIDKKITTKPGGSGAKFSINLGDEFGEEKTEVVGGANYTVYDAVEIPTTVKPLSASGLTVVKPDGTTEEVDGVRDVDLNSFQVVEVRDPNDPNKFIKKKVVVGTHKETTPGTTKNPNGKEIEVTALYDMDEIGSRIKTDLLQNPEEWDQMNKRFDQELNKEVELDDLSGFQPR